MKLKYTFKFKCLCCKCPTSMQLRNRKVEKQLFISQILNGVRLKYLINSCQSQIGEKGKVSQKNF